MKNSMKSSGASANESTASKERSAKPKEYYARIRREMIEDMLAREAEKIWGMHALDHQKPPPGDWTTWLILGGRGCGKTRAGAEWIRGLVANTANDDPGPAGAVALVAETYADAREVMIEGPSGIIACAAAPSRPVYEASRRRLLWPNGAVAHCFSAEDPDGIRGYQFTAAWSDELVKWRYAEETWSNLQLALRLGARPRQIATTTPRPIGLIKRLLEAPTTAVTRATSYDNRANLSDAFFTEIAALYEGTALGRQELLGEIIDDAPGALWNWAMIEAARISHYPPLSRIVVAVDPPATAGEDADACGIVVAGADGAGEARDRTAYVLADRSANRLSPRRWAERAVAAFHEFEADRIVVELNQGGDMAKAVIAQVDAGAPVKGVYATRGKTLRAEPVAALYERGAVRHVGAFPGLEQEMTRFTGAGTSPDRLDALVWALTDLMICPRAPRPGVQRTG
jgi:phage terminase large subunit-like protein